MTRLLLAVLSTLVLVEPVVGQQTSVELQVRDSVSSRPVVSARVEIVNIVGSTEAVILSDDLGNVQAQLPEPGTYVARVTRIGYPVWTSEAFEVPATSSVLLRVPGTAIKLEGISGSTEATCPTTQAQRDSAFSVYEAALPGLRRVVKGDRQEAYRYASRVVSPVRVWSHGWRWGVDTTTVVTDRAHLTDPPEVLAAQGYAVPRGDSLNLYLSPGAETVADPSFLRVHCIAPSSRSDSGEIGIEYWPKGDRGLVDIRGVLWFELDSEGSPVPSRVEFTYTGLQEFVETHHMPWLVAHWAARQREEGLRPPKISRPIISESQFGGSVEFSEVSPGIWVTTRWEILGVFLGSNASFRAGSAPEVVPQAIPMRTESQLGALVPIEGRE